MFSNKEMIKLEEIDLNPDLNSIHVYVHGNTTWYSKNTYDFRASHAGLA
jgi:hypothetical protein